jgi:hypothetical protein
MKHVLTYALEFRGEARDDGSEISMRASAPPCSHVTQLAHEGVESRFVYDDGVEEAFMESRLTLNGGGGAFSARMTLDFGHGHELHLRTLDDGRLVDSADENLRHGTAAFEVVEGTGQFEGATGRITSNFVVSDTGDLTDNQLGIVFVRPQAASTRSG